MNVADVKENVPQQGELVTDWFDNLESYETSRTMKDRSHT